MFIPDRQLYELTISEDARHSVEALAKQAALNNASVPFDSWPPGTSGWKISERVILKGEDDWDAVIVWAVLVLGKDGRLYEGRREMRDVHSDFSRSTDKIEYSTDSIDHAKWDAEYFDDPAKGGFTRQPRGSYHSEYTGAARKALTDFDNANHSSSTSGGDIPAPPADTAQEGLKHAARLQRIAIAKLASGSLTGVALGLALAYVRSLWLSTGDLLPEFVSVPFLLFVGLIVGLIFGAWDVRQPYGFSDGVVGGGLLGGILAGICVIIGVIADAFVNDLNALEKVLVVILNGGFGGLIAAVVGALLFGATGAVYGILRRVVTTFV